MQKKVIMGIVILSATFLFSGCGRNIVEKAIESQTGGKVDINSEKGEMTLKNDQGDISMSGDGNATLNPNFPKDIYITQDAKIQFSMANGQNSSYSVAYITDTQVDEIYSKYKDDLAAKGWAADPQTEMIFGDSKTITYKKGNQRLTVIAGLSQDDQWRGKTSIQITGTENNIAN